MVILQVSRASSTLSACAAGAVTARIAAEITHLEVALRAAGKFADLRRNKRELLSEGINDPNQIDDLQLGNTSKFAPGCHEIHRRPPEPRVPGEPPPHAFVNQVAWTVIFPGNPP